MLLYMDQLYNLFGVGQQNEDDNESVETLSVVDAEEMEERLAEFEEDENEDGEGDGPAPASQTNEEEDPLQVGGKRKVRKYRKKRRTATKKNIQKKSKKQVKRKKKTMKKSKRKVKGRKVKSKSRKRK